ncbi:MAG: transcriptional regulator [Terracidiphilus sp.]
MPETAQLYMELWVSLASLLRSYTAVHGLNGDRQATVELGEEKITVRHGDAWLDLKRNGAQVMWKRDDGQGGMLKFTEAGRLRSASGEEEMDIAAEAWARELMR